MNLFLFLNNGAGGDDSIFLHLVLESYLVIDLEADLTVSTNLVADLTVSTTFLRISAADDSLSSSFNLSNFSKYSSLSFSY